MLSIFQNGTWSHSLCSLTIPGGLGAASTPTGKMICVRPLSKLKNTTQNFQTVNRSLTCCRQSIPLSSSERTKCVWRKGEARDGSRVCSGLRTDKGQKGREHHVDRHSQKYDLERKLEVDTQAILVLPQASAPVSSYCILHSTSIHTIIRNRPLSQVPFV